MPTYVHLWELDNPVILVPAPTTVIYCNQVDGVATGHRELEGFLLPLPRVQARVFDPDWWYKHHNRRYKGDEAHWARACEEMERELAGVLAFAGTVRHLKVDAEADGCEAWVPVEFTFADRGPDGLSETYPRLDGILTWANCD
jgi:hypothetical protein